jgi:hypothetical protein
MEAATAPAKPRTKNPSYLVFRRENETEFTLLTAKPINASSRKAAIVEATKEDERTPEGLAEAGTYLVIPASEFQPIKRKTSLKVVNEFA